jgi:hypothetical protein
MAYTNIDDPSAYFQTKVYTGSNSNQSITNDGNSDLQPDFIFASYRTLPPYTNHRAIIDSSRGRAKILESDTNAAEATTTNAAYDLVSFDTDGFTIGAVNSTSALNASGINHIAWQWKANGGTTVSNTDGTITSTVQANTDAGFSIVTYTGNATDNATVGHGLGVVPSVIIIKDLTDGSVWGVWHKDLTDAGYRLTLSTDAATSNDPGYMGGGNRTLPTSSVFSLGQGGGGNGTNAYVAYCFAEKQGFSQFGSYRGNQDSNGMMCYCSFRPAWVMIKKASGTGPWNIFDSKRDGYNIDYLPTIQANSNGAEFANLSQSIDILSNGFKIRTNQADINQSNQEYIYMAFAENPFVTSTGVPTTAR